MTEIRNSDVFGPWINLDLPEGADAVIVCENDGRGLKPLSLRLRHQVYMKDVKNVKGLTIIPIRSLEYINATPWVQGRPLTLAEHLGWTECPACQGKGQVGGGICGWIPGGNTTCGGSGVVPPE